MLLRTAEAFLLALYNFLSRCQGCFFLADITGAELCAGPIKTSMLTSSEMQGLGFYSVDFKTSKRTEIHLRMEMFSEYP